MSDSAGILSGRLLVVAFEGWNDAGEAASGAVRTLKEQLELYPIAEVDPEDYFDFQFNRPTVASRRRRRPRADLAERDDVRSDRPAKKVSAWPTTRSSR